MHHHTSCLFVGPLVCRAEDGRWTLVGVSIIKISKTNKQRTKQILKHCQQWQSSSSPRPPAGAPSAMQTGAFAFDFNFAIAFAFAFVIAFDFAIVIAFAIAYHCCTSVAISYQPFNQSTMMTFQLSPPPGTVYLEVETIHTIPVYLVHPLMTFHPQVHPWGVGQDPKYARLD